MEKILLLCDSASDISIQQEKQLPIRVLNVSIVMAGQNYQDRVELGSEAIYQTVARNSKVQDFPRTAHLTPFVYLEAYHQAALEGYTNIICISMNAKGSATHDASMRAIALYAQEYEEEAKKLQIDCIDSGSYSLGIGFGILQAADWIKQGIPAKEIVIRLKEHYLNQTTLVGLYALDYAKKSGRLNGVAAFMGELIGLRPVLSVAGDNRMVGKVRGDRNLVPKLAAMYLNDAIDPKGDYVVAYGQDVACANALVGLIEQAGGKKPLLMQQVGSCIAINAGPKMVGIAYLSKRAYQQ